MTHDGIPENPQHYRAEWATLADPERFTSLLHDVETKIFAELPDETWVYPGHGDDTTLGAERPHLAEWRERGW